MRTDITEQDMLNELRVIAHADLRRLSNIFGSHNIVEVEDVAIDEMPVTKNMRVLFDYVVHARISTGFPLSDVLHDLTDYFLETVPHSPMIDLYRDEPIEGICRWIVDTAVVRWGMDFEEISSFTIKQVATLANMDERSVRNAANPKQANSLKTFRAIDGSTMVSRDDAITWLSGRRSFKPTTFVDESGERDLAHDEFRDLLDLGLYIKEESRKQGVELSHLLRDAGLEKEYAEWLTGKGTEHFFFDVDRFRRLAISLGKDEREFSLAACKAFQKAELHYLGIKLKRPIAEG